MPKFRVILGRSWYQTARIILETETLKEAGEKALEQAGHLWWRFNPEPDEGAEIIVIDPLAGTIEEAQEVDDDEIPK